MAIGVFTWLLLYSNPSEPNPEKLRISESLETLLKRSKQVLILFKNWP